MKILRTALRDHWTTRSIAYVLSYLQFRLYGVQHGARLRARRVQLLNMGHIQIGDRTSLTSYPDGTSYLCSLRTYFPESRIEIGNHCVLNGAVLHSNELIRLGNRVMLGPGVIVLDNDSHPPVASDERYTARAPQSPVDIQSGVWVGMRSMVMKGVTIGENTIVAAGSIVTRNLPANVLAAGVPARPLRPLAADVRELNHLGTASSQVNI